MINLNLKVRKIRDILITNIEDLINYLSVMILKTYDLQKY